MLRLLKKLLKRNRRFSLVYVDAGGNVTYSKSIDSCRLNDIRGIMLNNEIELEVMAVPFMTYAASVKKASANKAELLSVKYKDLYIKSLRPFNDLIYELMNAGHRTAAPFYHCDPVWCQEHDDEYAAGLEISSEIHQGNYFQYFPAWCRLQHRH